MKAIYQFNPIEPGRPPRIRGNTNTQNRLVGKLNREISRRHRDIQDNLLQSIRDDIVRVKIDDDKRAALDSTSSDRIEVALGIAYADILNDLAGIVDAIRESRAENEDLQTSTRPPTAMLAIISVIFRILVCIRDSLVVFLVKHNKCYFSRVYYITTARRPGISVCARR
jgi:hypothetical protein